LTEKPDVSTTKIAMCAISIGIIFSICIFAVYQEGEEKETLTIFEIRIFTAKTV
jgi:hypothetical protein